MPQVSNVSKGIGYQVTDAIGKFWDWLADNATITVITVLTPIVLKVLQAYRQASEVKAKRALEKKKVETLLGEHELRVLEKSAKLIESRVDWVMIGYQTLQKEVGQWREWAKTLPPEYQPDFNTKEEEKDESDN